MTKLEALVDIAGPELGAQLVSLSEEVRAAAGGLGGQLQNLLSQRNGFYAFESALHVLPSRDHGVERGLDNWNARDVRRASYDGIADAYVFFAEDAFGGQFRLEANGVYSFDPRPARQCFSPVT